LLEEYKLKSEIDGTCDNCDSSTKVSEVRLDTGDNSKKQDLCEYCVNMDEPESVPSRDLSRMMNVLEARLSVRNASKELISENEALKLKIGSHITLLGDIKSEVAANANKGLTKKDNQLNNVYKLTEKGLKI